MSLSIHILKGIIRNFDWSPDVILARIYDHASITIVRVEVLEIGIADLEFGLQYQLDIDGASLESHGSSKVALIYRDNLARKESDSVLNGIVYSRVAGGRKVILVKYVIIEGKGLGSNREQPVDGELGKDIGVEVRIAYTDSTKDRHDIHR